MKKILFIVLFFISGTILASAFYINSLTQTPHGTMDWHMALFLKVMGLKNGVYNTSLTPTQNRKKMDTPVPLMNKKYKMIGAVKNFSIEGPGGKILLRLYNPSLIRKTYPVVLFFHGGGFTIGNLETHDHICRAITSVSNAKVLAVNYRLAPEHPFPAAVDDAWAAAKWLYKNAKKINCDKNNIFVAGDSAGGNLSAVTAIRARDRDGVKIRGQILIYPAVDPGNYSTPTVKKYGHGYFLTIKDMKTFTNFYLPDKKTRFHRDAAPLRVKNLFKLPPAFILTAQFDPLRWSDERYALRLKKSGVSVKIKQYRKVVHGFLNFLGIVPAADSAIDDIGRFITGNKKQ